MATRNHFTHLDKDARKAIEDGVYEGRSLAWIADSIGVDATSDFEGLERGGRCRLFYTDPQRSDQKGGCEKNHVELRKIIPKGTSLDSLRLDAWLVAGICSHANSSMRLSIGDASPMALAIAAFPISLIEGLVALS